MNERESLIRLWFDMWLQKKDMGVDDIFTEDVVYIESWSPKYEDRKTVKHWFEEWNTRATVLAWEIKQFFHKGNQTVVEWYFQNQSVNGPIEAFDGMSLIEWTDDKKSSFSKNLAAISTITIHTRMAMSRNFEMKRQAGFEWDEPGFVEKNKNDFCNL